MVTEPVIQLKVGVVHLPGPIARPIVSPRTLLARHARKSVLTKHRVAKECRDNCCEFSWVLRRHVDALPVHHDDASYISVL